MKEKIQMTEGQLKELVSETVRKTITNLMNENLGGFAPVWIEKNDVLAFYARNHKDGKELIEMYKDIPDRFRMEIRYKLRDSGKYTWSGLRMVDSIYQNVAVPYEGKVKFSEALRKYIGRNLQHLMHDSRA